VFWIWIIIALGSIIVSDSRIENSLFSYYSTLIWPWSLLILECFLVLFIQSKNYGIILKNHKSLMISVSWLLFLYSAFYSCSSHFSSNIISLYSFKIQQLSKISKENAPIPSLPMMQEQKITSIKFLVLTSSYGSSLLMVNQENLWEMVLAGIKNLFQTLLQSNSEKKIRFNSTSSQYPVPSTFRNSERIFALYLYKS